MDKKALILDEKTQELLLNYEFKYFLDRVIEKQGCTNGQLVKLHNAYKITKEKLDKEKRTNTKQFILYLEGQVRFMVENKGFIPGLFVLDGWTREVKILDFDGFGQDWAYFELWQSYKKRRISRKKWWELIKNVGTLLAYLVAVMELLSFIKIT